ncbi:NAD-P-binding protein [Cyathus striatus]|nr:NAD-P-binding protein [Cyathus striatus]
MPKVWLVTGASSGFGLEVSRVVATARNPSHLNVLKDSVQNIREQLLYLQCDVTKASEITDSFKQAIDHFGRCDVVFNNAGYGMLGEIESTPEDTARKLFDTNFWGAANVSREAVRVFRECNSGMPGGRLLNMSSGAGFVGIPGVGYYSASKHALEGFTKSLHKEVDPTWNIRISILEPGSFKTNAHTKNNVTVPAIPACSRPELPSQQVRQVFEAAEKIKGDVRRAAIKIFEFASLPNPPLRWALGKEAVAGVKKKITQVGNDMELLEHWSDDLVLDEVED